MARTERTYLPAAGHDWLLPVYDPLTKLLGIEPVYRALVEQAGLRPGLRVLEVGCGSGSLTVLAARSDVELVALDPDPRALARARRKASRAGVTVRFDQGLAEALAYPDGVFDRVLSSMVLHHLGDADKVRALREMRRVLRPGGSVELLDLLRPEPHAGGLSRLFHSSAALSTAPDVVSFMAEAGFTTVRAVAQRHTVLGPVGFFQAS